MFWYFKAADCELFHSHGGLRLEYSKHNLYILLFIIFNHAFNRRDEKFALSGMRFNVYFLLMIGTSTQLLTTTASHFLNFQIFLQ